MKTVFRIASPMLKAIHADLSRPHRFALERVGFIACRQTNLQDGLTFLSDSYHPVADNDYLQSRVAGAMMGPDAIRKALQLSHTEKFSMFHVHRHEHIGNPKFSPLDLRESAKFIPNFWNVCPDIGHGALVLSYDSMFGFVWDSRDRLRKPIQELIIVGRPLKTIGV